MSIQHDDPGNDMRDALAAAVGEGVIFSAEDVAALRRVMAQLGDPVGVSGVVGVSDPQGMYTFWARRADLDRLRAVLAVPG